MPTRILVQLLPVAAVTVAVIFLVELKGLFYVPNSPIAKLSQSSGIVRRMPRNSLVLDQLSPGSKVDDGDVIFVSRSGRARLIFQSGESLDLDGGSLFVVRPNSSLENLANANYSSRGLASFSGSEFEKVSLENPLLPPQPLAPKDGFAGEVGRTVEFRWKFSGQVTELKSFELYLKKTEDPTFARMFTSPTEIQTVNDLTRGHYVWMIRSIDKSGLRGTFSSSHAFAILPLSEPRVVKRVVVSRPISMRLKQPPKPQVKAAVFPKPESIAKPLLKKPVPAWQRSPAKNAAEKSEVPVLLAPQSVPKAVEH